MRVALVTNQVPPYRVPVYRDLARTPGWKLRVLTSARSDPNHPWHPDAGDLDVERVWGLARRRRIAAPGSGFAEVVTLHLPLGLPAALHRFRPDVVVSGELGPRTALALGYCSLARVPLVIWSYHSRVSAATAGAPLRGLRRALLARASAVAGMGAQAREVLRGCGVPAQRIFDAPNAHDADTISRHLPEAASAGARRELTDKLGARERIALVAGRLAPAKGIAQTLHAWARLPRGLRDDWTLLFVGSGPLEPAVRAAGAQAAPGEILHVAAVQPDELVAYYAAARLLVFPSLGDPWGLVVNEAFACGRPVLCSRLAGCADDLVRPGENGWLFDPTDAEEFSRALGAALASPELERLGRAARRAAAAVRPEAMAAGLRRAVRAACNSATP